jgi:flagellar basal body-associated protein FliL
MKKLMLILSVIIAIVVFLAVAYGIFNYTVKKITEREVKKLIYH